MDSDTRGLDHDDLAAGRHLSQPTKFPGRAWWSVLKRTFNDIGEDHLSIIASGVAFWGMLAVFPSIAALIAIYGLVADPSQIAQSLDTVKPFLPVDVYTMIDGQISQIVSAGQGTLGLATLVSILFALWTSRTSVTALLEGLNIVYGERDTRNIIIQNLFALMMTLVLIIMLIIALLAVVAVPAILQFIELGQLGTILARVAPLLILAVAVTFVIGALYRYGPSRRRARVRWVSIGAIIATVGWLVVSVGLSSYISNFANFNKTYGSLGAIVAVLFWLYASAFVVLIGAEINANLELQTCRDTTSGRPKPIGKRGAFVADHVA
jgi:membrane protein